MSEEISTTKVSVGKDDESTTGWKKRALKKKEKKKERKRKLAMTAAATDPQIDELKLKKRRKIEEDAQVEAIPASTGWEAKQRVKALAKQDKQKKREAKLDDKAKAAKDKQLEEKLNRQAQNRALTAKGKLTKKEEFLAARAAKKAEAQKVHIENSQFNVQEALLTLKLDTLDPKATSCFLSGLPYLASEKHVADHFLKIGHCTVQLLLDQVTAKPNGLGFVTFATAERALEAATHTGCKLQGRWIKIRLCEPRDTGLIKEGAKPEGCLSVVVKCDVSISEASLNKFFKDCYVSNISRMMDKETGEFRGTAFMDFEDTAMTDKAVEKNGKTIKGLPISVRYKQEKKVANVDPVQHNGRGVAPHNRAPPVPPPSGQAKKLDSDSDSDV